MSKICTKLLQPTGSKPGQTPNRNNDKGLEASSWHFPKEDTQRDNG